MGWLTWLRGAPAEPGEPTRSAAGPAAGSATMRARFEAWQRWWAAQRGPTPEQLQAVEDARLREAGRAFTDEVLKACARNGGVYFPGDGDEPRIPARETWEGEGGVRWFRL